MSIPRPVSLQYFKRILGVPVSRLLRVQERTREPRTEYTVSVDTKLVGGKQGTVEVLVVLRPPTIYFYFYSHYNDCFSRPLTHVLTTITRDSLEGRGNGDEGIGPDLEFNEGGPLSDQTP